MPDTVAHVYGLRPDDVKLTDYEPHGNRRRAQLYAANAFVIEISHDDDALVAVDELAERLKALAKTALKLREQRADAAEIAMADRETAAIQKEEGW